MVDFVVPAPERVTLPVAGSAARFPVRRVYCIGRNYVEHIREMGGDDRRYLRRQRAGRMADDRRRVEMVARAHGSPPS